MPQRERGHERAQRGRLARPWTADDPDVAAGCRDVDHERFAALLERQVDGADRDAQLGPGRAEAPARMLGEPAHEHVERLGCLERGQPDLVRLAATRGDLLDHHAEHGGPGGIVLGRRYRGTDGHVPRSGQDRRRERAHLARPGEQRVRQLGPVAVGARDVGGAEAGQHGGVGLQQAVTRGAGQRVGLVHPEDGAALLRGEGAQRDPVRQVRLQPPDLALLQALAGQQQVQAQRAAQAPDLHEQLDELLPLGDQLGELVDDQEQVGQRGQRRAALPGPLVVADGDEVARGPQELLAPVELAGERLVHAGDQALVVLQVRDHRGDLAEPGHPGEGRAALEVDEHHVQHVRRVRGGEPEDQRAQQLGLARPGGPDQQAVRAHPVLGGLLEVQLEHRAVGGDPDGRPQPVAQRARPPQPLQVQRRGVGGAQQRGQGRLDRVEVLREGPRREPVARQLPGQGLGHRRRDGVGPAQVLALLPGDDGELRLVGPVDLQLHAAPADHLGGVAVEVEHRHRLQPLGVERQLAAGDPGAVEDDQDVRQVRRRVRVGVEPGPAGQLGAEQVFEHLQRRVDQPDGAGVVELGGVAGVGQPLHPRPVRVVRARGGDDDDQVRRRVEDRGLAEQRPHERAGGVGVVGRGDADALRTGAAPPAAAGRARCGGW